MTTREKVFSYLPTTLTGYLQSTFGKKSACSRVLDEDPEKLQAEGTPRCWLLEESSSLSDDSGYAIREVHFTVYGCVKLGANTNDAGCIQAQLNELEACIENLLWISVINGVGVCIIPEDGARVTTAAGELEGWITYPLVVKFGRTA